MVEIGAGQVAKSLHWLHDKTKHVSAHLGPSLILQISSRSVPVKGSYNRKTLQDPTMWMQYTLFESITKVAITKIN